MGGESCWTRYVTHREGYALRYQIYCEAETPEELFEEDTDEEEQDRRGWRFVQHLGGTALNFCWAGT
ncbi:MAG: hypothetical protein ACLVLH_15500 [Eisenbergiella massiliensis]